MNKDDAKYFLPLVQALSEGKIIQIATGRTGERWVDMNQDEITLGFYPSADYRIKPIPIEVYAIVHADSGIVYFHKEISSVEKCYKNYYSKYENYRITKLTEEI